MGRTAWRLAFTGAFLLIFLEYFSVAFAEKKEFSFAVAVYHFNLQYVAGDRDIENRIITESLDPLLDFYDAHPEWGADFEMQGYMVERLAESFPEILGKMRKLIDRGQIELVSFHYSDQLFLAYPRHDMEVSHIINTRILQENKIARSGVVFTQEGQFSEGMTKFMEDNGFTIAVLPKNLYRYFHKSETPAVFYKLGNTFVVLGGAGARYEDERNKVNLIWTFMDDGELLPTKRVTPYSPEFKFKKEALDEYEDKLKELERNGVKIVTVSQYIEKMKELGVQPTDLPPVPDGTWQPIDTDNVFRWMGDYKGAHERDNEVLTRNFKARNRLCALDALVSDLKNRKKDVVNLDKKLEDIWKKQLLAEVSDSTGWTPMPGEIDYSFKLNEQVEKEIEEIAGAAKAVLGTDYLNVSFHDGALHIEVQPVEDMQWPERETDCPLEIRLEGEFKKSELKCFQVNNDGTRIEARARFVTTNWHHNDVRMIFPRVSDSFIYGSALNEDELVNYPFEKFDLEKSLVYLPAPNGLLGIGENLFLLKHNETVHVAWEIDTAGKTAALRMLHPPNREYYWVVSIVRGDGDTAVRAARGINTFPPVVF